MMPVVLRTVLAILGGYAAMVTLVVLFMGALKKFGPSSNPIDGSPAATYLILNIGYSFIAAAVGGYVAAWVAGRLPVQHGIGLGGFVLVMSVVSALEHGNRQPRWYQVTLAVFIPLAIVLGAWVRAWQS
jgi:hypothetical protein